jgi:hypothetical protein
MRANAQFPSDRSATNTITYTLVGVNVCIIVQFIITLAERYFLN